MLFGEGRRNLAGLYATHPPLMQRISALDPTFRPAEVEQLRQQNAQHAPNGLQEDAALGLVGDEGAARPANVPTHVPPQTVSGLVGTSAPEAGARLNAQIPDTYRTAASQASAAVPLVVGLLRGQASDLDPMLRLAVVQLAAPQLAARPAGERAALLAQLDEIAHADNTITAFEYCLKRVVGSYLRDAEAPASRSRPGRAPVQAVQDAALTLLATIAAAGNADGAAAERAFHAAVARLLPGRSVAYAPPADPWRALDAGWDALDSLDPRNKRVIVESLVAAVSDDGVLTVDEAELLRTACTLLHCPLPPLLGAAP
jgi:hypothetical protein